MIRNTTLSMAAVIAFSSAAFASPEDYQERIPHNIHDMELVAWDIQEGELIAQYGETIGRATLRIFPAPEADPGGAHESEEISSGETPAAQLALLERLARNYEEGTNALPDGYTTAPVVLNTVRLDGGSSDGAVLSCGTIEREPPVEASEEGNPIARLVDRTCAFQHGDDVMTVFITTPLPDDERVFELNRNAHFTFAALLIAALIDESDG